MFPSLIGSSITGFAVSSLASRRQVSIPYRKFNNKNIKNLTKSLMSVSIPYRKFNNAKRGNMASALLFVSIPYRKFNNQKSLTLTLLN